jgi:hypothetical protein
MRALILLLGLAACAPAAGPRSGGLESRGLWADPPACVLVLPADTAAEIGLSPRQAEEALARHLAGRFDRVIGPARRDALIRRLGLVLDHPGDRRRLAARTGCRHAALARFWGGRGWGVVWSETRIGVDLAILRLADGEHLWLGRDSARRGDGGLPLSPVSAAVAAGLAARAALDRETAASVLDDALRSLLRDLPDLRDAQAFASRNSRVRPLSSRK